MYINRDEEIVQLLLKNKRLTLNYLYLLIGISLLLFIYVSDAYTPYTHSNKNKMGFSNLSALYNKKSEMLLAHLFSFKKRKQETWHNANQIQIP